MTKHALVTASRFLFLLFCFSVVYWTTESDNRPDGPRQTTLSAAPESLVQQLAEAELESIPLHSDATPRFQNYTDGVFHDPVSKSVIVRFKSSNDRPLPCPRPVLRGRLSGPSLAILTNWTMHYPQSMDDKHLVELRATYDVPLAGRYFVDIIAMLCDDWRLGPDPESFNYRNLCIEDVNHNRITHPEAAWIDIQPAAGSPNGAIGFWYRNESEAISDETHLITRVQPPYCKNAMKRDPACVPFFFREDHLSYSFRFTDTSMSVEDLHKRIQATDNKDTICTIGKSHSEYLVLRGFNNIGLGERARWISTRYPEDVVDVLDDIRSFGCNKFIVAIGQWPSSFKPENPYTVGKFRSTMTDAVHLLSSEFPDAEIYLRSIHYLPLGFKRSACPPDDFRDPALIDAYNTALDSICDSTHKCTYVANRFITEPMWDEAEDWNHPTELVYVPEALYLSYYVMNFLQNRNR